MSSLVEAFVKLPHRKMYDSVDLQEVLLLVRAQLGNESLNQQWVYFFHSDPVYFCLGFLEILDRGGAPIALSSVQNLQPDSWLFTEGEWKKTGPPRKVKEDGRFYAVPTSGTTGKPKICEFELSSAMKLAESHALAFGCNSHYEIVQTLPVHHSFGVIAYVLAPLVAKCGVNFCSSMMGLRKLKKDKEARPCIMHVSPSQLRFILREGVTAESLKKISIGGGAVTIGELDKLQGLLVHCEIYVTYGLTEAGPRVSTGIYSKEFKTKYSPDDNETWIGSPLFGIEVMIANEGGNDGDNVAEQTSSVGKLWIKTPHRKRNATKEELSGEWLMTRDRVKLVGREIFFLSREDDLIKYGGVTIYPRDIEQLATSWPMVTDAIVLKSSDPMYGERPLLFIEGTIAPEKANELLYQAVNYASAFSEIYVIERFPRQSLEKINRSKLLEMVGKQKHD